MADELIVFVSCPISLIEPIANTLIDERLAACVNVLPKVQSYFHWQGKLCREEESLLLIKSNKIAWTRLEERIKQLHSYELPEIICVEIDKGYLPYLDWLNSSIEYSKPSL